MITRRTKTSQGGEGSGGNPSGNGDGDGRCSSSDRRLALMLCVTSTPPILIHFAVPQHSTVAEVIREEHLGSTLSSVHTKYSFELRWVFVAAFVQRRIFTMVVGRQTAVWLLVECRKSPTELLAISVYQFELSETLLFS